MGYLKNQRILPKLVIGFALLLNIMRQILLPLAFNLIEISY